MRLHHGNMPCISKSVRSFQPSSAIAEEWATFTPHAFAASQVGVLVVSRGTALLEAGAGTRFFLAHCPLSTGLLLGSCSRACVDAGYHVSLAAGICGGCDCDHAEMGLTAADKNFSD